VTDERNRRQTRVGVVISDKMMKTVVVRVETTRRHPTYGKTLRHVLKFKAHNAEDQAKQGDRVLVASTRPLSKDKRWRVVQVLEKAR
jgi:small subunit ribosomal protein S17